MLFEKIKCVEFYENKDTLKLLIYLGNILDSNPQDLSQNHELKSLFCSAEPVLYSLYEVGKVRALNTRSEANDGI